MENKNRVCPVERSGSLDNRLRKLVHNPEKMFRKYIREGMAVLDFGCGPGFFTRGMAEMVGDEGTVIAADLQQGMLDKLSEKIKGTHLEKRIFLHRTAKNSIRLKKKIDFALAFYMMHEIPDQEKALKEISSLLRPGGILYVVEPKYFHVSEEEFGETIKRAEKNGLGLVERPGVFLSRAAVLKK